MHSSRRRTRRSLTVCFPEGCLLQGDLLYLEGGCLLSGGVWCPGDVSQRALRQTPSPPRGQNSLHTLVKTLPWPQLLLRAVIMTILEPVAVDDGLARLTDMRDRIWYPTSAETCIWESYQLPYWLPRGQ